MTCCVKNCFISPGFPEAGLPKLELSSHEDQLLGTANNTQPHSKQQAKAQSEGHFLRCQEELKLCLKELDEGTSQSLENVYTTFDHMVLRQLYWRDHYKLVLKVLP